MATDMLFSRLPSQKVADESLFVTGYDYISQ